MRCPICSAVPFVLYPPPLFDPVGFTMILTCIWLFLHIICSTVPRFYKGSTHWISRFVDVQRQALYLPLSVFVGVQPTTRSCGGLGYHRWIPVWEHYGLSYPPFPGADGCEVGDLPRIMLLGHHHCSAFEFLDWCRQTRRYTGLQYLPEGLCTQFCVLMRSAICLGMSKFPLSIYIAIYMNFQSDALASHEVGTRVTSVPHH